jgi:hypothetical protein
MMLHQNMALELVVLEVLQNHLFVFVFYRQSKHLEHRVRAFFSFF